MKYFIFPFVKFVLNGERKVAKYTVVAASRGEAEKVIVGFTINRWQNLLGEPTDFDFGVSSSVNAYAPMVIDYREEE